MLWLVDTAARLYLRVSAMLWLDRHCCAALRVSVWLFWWIDTAARLCVYLVGSGSTLLCGSARICLALLVDRLCFLCLVGFGSTQRSSAYICSGWIDVMRLCVVNLIGSGSIILDREVDPNLARSDNGGTIVRAACHHGHLKCLQLLRERHVELSIKDSLGRTPLDVARLSK